MAASGRCASDAKNDDDAVVENEGDECNDRGEPHTSHVAALALSLANVHAAHVHMSREYTIDVRPFFSIFPHFFFLSGAHPVIHLNDWPGQK